MENHNWYAVIPASVLMDNNLSDKQKLLIALVSNLSNEKGYCFASNRYLGERLNCSEVTIRQNVTFLEEYGLLSRVLKLKASGEIDYRALTVLKKDPPIKNNRTPDEIQSDPSDEKQSYNNKYINNKEYNLFPETSSGNNPDGDGTIIKKETVPPLYSKMIDIWFTEIHPDFVFSKIDGLKMKSVIKKTTTLLSKYNRPTRDEDVSGFFRMVCQNLPDFFKDKDLKTIDADFNQIIEKIKSTNNGTNKNTKPTSKYAPQR